MLEAWCHDSSCIVDGSNIKVQKVGILQTHRDRWYLVLSHVFAYDTYADALLHVGAYFYSCCCPVAVACPRTKGCSNRDQPSHRRCQFLNQKYLMARAVLQSITVFPSLK